LGVIFKTGLLQELASDLILAATVYPGMTEGEKTWVQLKPLPFSYEAETNAAMYDCSRDPRADYVIRLTHASILPVGLPFLAYKMPHVSADMVWGQKGWDLLVNGHIHHHSEVIQSGNQHFVNIGAVARGALNSWALEQTPKVLGLDIVRGQKPVFTWHGLKVAPATEIFRVEEAILMKDRKADMMQFVSQIKANEGTADRPVVNLGVMLDEYLTDNRATPVVARKVKEYVGIK